MAAAAARFNVLVKMSASAQDRRDICIIRNGGPEVYTFTRLPFVVFFGTNVLDLRGAGYTESCR